PVRPLPFRHGPRPVVLVQRSETGPERRTEHEHRQPASRPTPPHRILPTPPVAPPAAALRPAPRSRARASRPGPTPPSRARSAPAPTTRKGRETFARGPTVSSPFRDPHAGDGFHRPNGNAGTGRTFPPQMNAAMTGRRGGFAPPWITIPGGSSHPVPTSGTSRSTMHHSVLQSTTMSSPTRRASRGTERSTSGHEAQIVVVY